MKLKNRGIINGSVSISNSVLVEEREGDLKKSVIFRLIF